LPTDIALEKKTNPFLRCGEPAIRESASRHAGRPLSDPIEVLATLREWKNNFK
jgi:hydroxyacylglutathione hydrolase